MPMLIGRNLEGAEVTVPLTARPVKIGRAATCEIVLRDDAEVSRVHAEVWLDDLGRVLVQDSSKNGTRVDDGEVFHNTRRYAQRNIRISDHEFVILHALPGPQANDDNAVRFTVDAPGAESGTQYFPSSHQYDLSQQRLNLLMRLSERIGGAFERKQLLEQALDACCDALNFERGLIVLKTQRGDSELPVSRNVEKDENGAYKISRTLINRALMEGKLAIVNNAATDLAGNMTESMVRYPIQSALCAPILHRDEIFGAIYGDRITQAQPYQPADVDFLGAIAQQVGVGLANLRLFQEYVKFQKVNAQLDDARQIQQGLLPRQPLKRGRVSLEGINQPSSIVGGDYFDYFPLDEHRVGIIIADVTGHGMPAALIMANLQSAVRVGLAADANLSVLAGSLNRLICSNTSPGVFITAIMGVIDTRTGMIDYINAGHPDPLLIGASSTPPLIDNVDRNSLPFGIDPREQFTPQRLESDGLRAALFYTDGLSEASNPAGQLLGTGPVCDILSTLDSLTTGNLIRVARATVQRHLDNLPPTDDMTLLALQFE